jgi:hypothetical protein
MPWHKGRVPLITARNLTSGGSLGSLFGSSGGEMVFEAMQRTLDLPSCVTIADLYREQPPFARGIGIDPSVVYLGPRGAQQPGQIRAVVGAGPLLTRAGPRGHRFRSSPLPLCPPATSFR